MKQSIEFLLSRLRGSYITRHIISPSACTILNEISLDIPDSIAIIDERSAGYVATGMCDEIGEPVVVWCADNDSFRSLAPSLTEAYYRKLPILIVALSCDSIINQSINPYDTIRYYINNSTTGSNGTCADIAAAINCLNAEVKGPVYLSIGRFEEKKQPARKNDLKRSQIMDASEIIKLLPSDSCVHIGSCISFDNNHIDSIIIRDNHCTDAGNLSMLIGSSLANQNQLHIGVFSCDEIAYDLNMLGNRHIGNNLLLISMQKQHNRAMYDFTNKMSWECKQVRMKDFASIKDSLNIGVKPKYIEIVL